MTANTQSIGLFIDGGYYAKVNEELKDTCSMNIHLASLMQFICTRVATLAHCDESDCHITESHYFRGRFRVSDANDKHLLYIERKFEDTLIENDVIFHYKHLREFVKDGISTVVEKGIDVWFALEAYELSLTRNFDYVVLITGDADHEMLVRKLNSLKIHTILLTWNVTSGKKSSTSKLLREEACTHIEMGELLANDATLLNKLCRTC